MIPCFFIANFGKHIRQTSFMNNTVHNIHPNEKISTEKQINEQAVVDDRYLDYRVVMLNMPVRNYTREEIGKFPLEKN